MGTRSLTFVHDGHAAKPFVNMYRQMDGYPSGHGKDLFEFLAPIKMINGLPLDKSEVKYANGSGCLAAQLVAHFKEDAGGIYLYAPSSVDCGQEYEYHIYAGEDGILVKVFAVPWRARKKLLFEGTVAEFGVFCNKPEED